jgi:hypothetical protein
MSEIVTLLTSGSIPGIPGEHGPGTYSVDYEARTIEPVDLVQPREAQQSIVQSEAVQQEDLQRAAEPVSPLQGWEQEAVKREQEIQMLASEEPHQVQ